MKTELKGYLNPDLKQKLQGPYGQKKEMAGNIPSRKGIYRILNEAIPLPTPQPDFSAPAGIKNASCITHPESDDHLLGRIPNRSDIKTTPSYTLDKRRVVCHILNRPSVVGHLTERLKSTQTETVQNAEEMLDTVKKGRHKDIKVNKDRIHQFAQPLKNLFASYTDDLRLRNDAFQTIKIYRHTFKKLCAAFPGSLSSEIRAADAKAWLAIKVRKRWNEPSLVTMVCALSLHDSNIVQKLDVIFYLPFPRREEKLPSVLSSQEVLALFNPSGNLKHKSIIMMACAGDLSENEVATFKKTDIDTGRMVIPVKGAKGKKDRCVPLLQTLLLSLKRSYTACTPGEYVFEGQDMDHYSARSLQKIFQKAGDGGKKIKNGEFHSLRQSFAKHLDEQGTDLRVMEALLERSSIKTTERYTQGSNRTLQRIQSPLVVLMDGKNADEGSLRNY